MIPVFQTRTATEALGNCFEACLASILELPLSRIPDKADHLPDDWPAQVEAARARGRLRDLEIDLGPYYDALNGWLENRGLSWLELGIDRRHGLTEDAWLAQVVEMRLGYWIGVHSSGGGEGAHAIVYRGGDVAHNPGRGLLGKEGLDRLIAAHILIVSDPRRLVRELGSEMLPDLGALVSDRAVARIEAHVERGVAEGLLSPAAAELWRSTAPDVEGGSIDYAAGRVSAHRSRPSG